MTGHRRGSWLSVFGLPILIGALSLAGLLSALLLDAPGRIFSWFALGLPPAIAVWTCWRSRR